MASPARSSAHDVGMTQEPDPPRVAGKRLLGLVNPRTPDGGLKDAAQIAKELQAHVDAKREDGSSR